MPTPAISEGNDDVTYRDSVWTYVVPITATNPKNTKTITSPSPR